MYIAEIVEANRLKAVVKDFDNFLLREACKIKGKAMNLLGNLTYNIIIFSS